MSIIGIDLGTTTSEVAYYKENHGEIIKNLQEGDSAIIPSVVMIENNNVLVGIKAKNQMILKSKNTVIEVKKYMGSEKTFQIEEKEYSVVDISSMILKKIKTIAEFYTGESIQDAVITVPANFNDKQRRDTKEAGILAGLNVERIVNEPTAAAIAYGFDKIKDNIKILVYDLGGGTLDVTILELFNGVLDVKASRGASIGGKDIDEALIKYFVREFYKKNKKILDIDNPRILAALKNASEECKKNLSFQKEWEVIIPYITKDEKGNPLDLNLVITEQLLNNISIELIHNTETVIDETLKGANLSCDEINKVILVGGSTRMPLVRNTISNKFGEKKIVSGINPEETVAIGAAILGGIKKTQIKGDKEKIVVLDSCSHTLGVEVLGNKMDAIILRDSKLPARVTKKYKTVDDNQDEAIINIYEGEEERVNENILLGTIEVKNIPKGPSGQEVLDITFEYDLNGILDVTVKTISTGSVQNITIGSKTIINSELSKDIKVNMDEERFDIDKDEASVPELNSSEEINSEENITYEKTKVMEEVEKVEETNSQGDEEDYSNIYGEVVSVVQYVNAHMNEYDGQVQSNIKSILQELLIAVRSDEYKKCRELETKVLNMIGIK